MNDCIEAKFNNGVIACNFAYGTALKSSMRNINICEKGVYKLVAYTLDNSSFSIEMVGSHQVGEEILGNGLIVRMLQINKLTEGECVTLTVKSNAETYILLSREYLYIEGDDSIDACQND